jgi:TRAP-type C4-dicarboxylate transport system permease small subunit
MLMTQLDRIERSLIRLSVVCGGVALVAMIGLACANIFVRTFGDPIRGTFELMGYGGAVVTALALGFTQKQRGHIAVNVLINRFPPQVQKALTSFNDAACAFFFGVLTWQLIRKAAGFVKTGEVSETLRIVFYPFTYAVAIGCGLLALVFVLSLIRDLLHEGRGSR